MVLVDTNVWLELLLGQPKAKDCLRLLEAIRDGRVEAAVTDFTVHSIAVILERRGSLAALEGFLRDLRRFAGLSYYAGTLEDQGEIAALAASEGLDFDDAYQLYFAAREAQAIVSFDRHFDGRKVARQEPADVLVAAGRP